MSVNISKKEFLSNVSEYCWFAQDLNNKDGVTLYEPVCDTIGAWLEEWVTAFNAKNKNFKVILLEEENYRIKRLGGFAFPSFDDVADEVYTLTAEECEEIGEICKCSVEEEED